MRQEFKPELIYYILPLAWFLVSLLLFIFYNLRNPLSNEEFAAFSQSFLQSKSINFTSSAFAIFLLIFTSNLIATFSNLAAGMLFAIFPLYAIWGNAKLIALVSVFSYHQYGIKFVLSSLVPHGIFELTAYFISAGLGIWLGVRFFRLIFLGEAKEFGLATAFAFRKFIMVVIPLLFLAALIEAYITPLIIQSFA